MKIDFILYQMDVKFGNPKANMKSIENLFDDYQTKNKIIILPELCLTGYDKKSIESTAFKKDQGEYLAKFLELSKSKESILYCSISSIYDEKYFNTGILIDKGKINSIYYKSHLFGPMGEKILFSKGSTVAPSTLKLSGEELNLGLSVCYDLRFPYIYQSYANNNAKLFLICAEWPITRVDHWVSLLKARAIENQSFILGVNRVGKDPDYEYGGHSAAFSPFGRKISGFKDDEDALEENVYRGTLDMNEVEEFRNKFDIREDKWMHPEKI